MRTTERNEESKLKRKLPTPASGNNSIKTDVVAVCFTYAKALNQMFLCIGSLTCLINSVITFIYRNYFLQFSH